MSLHTSCIAITTGRPLNPQQMLTALGLQGAQAELRIPVGRALTLGPDDGLAIASVDSWCVIYGSALYMPMLGSDGKQIPMGPSFWNAVVQKKLVDLSQSGAKIFGFIAEGASMTYGFEWYDSGLKRRYLEVDGDQVISEGAPLRGEEDIFDKTEDQEERIWLLMEPHTLSFEKTNVVEFTQFVGVTGA